MNSNRIESIRKIYFELKRRWNVLKINRSAQDISNEGTITTSKRINHKITMKYRLVESENRSENNCMYRTIYYKIKRDEKRTYIVYNLFIVHIFHIEKCSSYVPWTVSTRQKNVRFDMIPCANPFRNGDYNCDACRICHCWVANPKMRWYVLNRTIWPRCQCSV